MNKGLSYWLNQLGWRLFPPSCVLCQAPGQPGIDLCKLCEADLPHNRTACSQCAKPLPMAGLCGACLAKPPAFDACQAAFSYQAGVAALVRGLKFQQQLANARLLAQLMLPSLEALNERPDLILPVPLHPERLKERGFNQSLELASYLGRALDIPVDTKSCARIKATLPQSSLGKKERKKNVRNAFALRGSLKARHLVLVDDVITTGNTLEELARLCKKAGVEKVSAWCAARA